MNNNQVEFNTLILNKTLNISDTRYPEFRLDKSDRPDGEIVKGSIC